VDVCGRVAKRRVSDNGKNEKDDGDQLDHDGLLSQHTVIQTLVCPLAVSCCSNGNTQKNVMDAAVFLS
jgi:hypothetical protein